MTIPLRFPLLAFACLAASAFAAETTAPTWPLWDGHETVEQYARRTSLPPMKTLDLGNGVNLELVLIPAGKFTMGTPEPVPVDEEGFRKKIIVGKAAFALGIGVLLVLIATVIIRAIRQRRRPQYSLARFMAMIVAASVAVMGGMHWWYSPQALVKAQAEYTAALARFHSSEECEKPAHDVTLTKPFYMARCETTQEQYAAVTGKNPSSLKGPNLPVECVAWDDAQEFCTRTSDVTGQIIRLPTEAEWEFACRAGTNTTYYTGDTDADLDKAAWYCDTSNGTTHPVGQKVANTFGLHDMHGNVSEWCAGWYEQYKPGAAVDPQGPAQGQSRVFHGGSWGRFPGDDRSAYRYGIEFPYFRSDTLGFRVVVEVPRTP